MEEYKAFLEAFLFRYVRILAVEASESYHFAVDSQVDLQLECPIGADDDRFHLP